MKPRPDDKTAFSINNRNGCPVNTAKMTTFETLCSWLELSDEVYSLDELYVIQFASHDNSSMYTKQHLKTKLLENMVATYFSLKLQVNIM